MKKTIIASAITAMISAGLSTSALAEDKPKMEKCYGIVKAGKNDCGIAGGNTCSGQIKTDNDAKAWIFLPRGSCEKITGGSTTPPKA
jgi:uncharacterized membrane protein